MIILVSRFNTGNIGDSAIAYAIKDEIEQYQPMCISIFTPLLKFSHVSSPKTNSKLIRVLCRTLDIIKINNNIITNKTIFILL